MEGEFTDWYFFQNNPGERGLRGSFDEVRLADVNSC